MVGPVHPSVTCPCCTSFVINRVSFTLGDGVWDPMLATQDSINPQRVMLPETCRLKRQTHM